MRVARKYLHQWTRPAKDFGFEGEQRLQEEFSEPGLRLRFDIKKKLCQVWLEDTGDCYLIYAIPAPFHITKAVYELKDREKQKRQLQQEYLDMLDEQERDKRRHIRGMAEEVGKVQYNALTGKVSVRV